MTKLTKKEIKERMKKFNPCISKELEEKLIKNPDLCKRILLQEAVMSKKLNESVLKFLCDKKYLSEMIEEAKKIEGEKMKQDLKELEEAFGFGKEGK